MNIYIPEPWLREYLKTSASVSDIQKYLSLCGPSVERIEKREGESVFDIEVTTNRVDCMSIIGIAREAATILNEFSLDASRVDVSEKLANIENDLPPLDIDIINDPKLCHRILAIKLENVSIKPSPAWMQKRLSQVGQRPLNNVIDITNYVMWEIGHPIHAFDYDKIKSKKIIVRNAIQGEIFTTLDNKTYHCIGGEVVLDDGTGTIIDLPGIMGTNNSVVDDNTQNVLLWIESIDANKIRFASMTHAIRTQAAILNEKQVDPHLGEFAFKRAIQLFKEYTGGTPASSVYDEFPQPYTPEPINLPLIKLHTYLGVNLDTPKILRILESLGCSTTVIKKDTITIIPPTYRTYDLATPVDLIEEVARIYGYQNLDNSIMATPIPDNPDKYDYQLEYEIKQWLSGWGTQEVYTYSMVSNHLALESGFPLEAHIKIINPLTDELEYMRRSLVPSLIAVLNDNPTHKVIVFEMQNTYHPINNKLPQERMTLAIVGNLGFRHTKGILDALMQKLYVQEWHTTSHTSPTLPFVSNEAGMIQVMNDQIGVIGMAVKNNKSYSCIEIDLYQLFKYTNTHPNAISIAANAPIIEDLTFDISDNDHVGPILTSLKKAHEYIEQVELKDKYMNNYTFTLTYRHPERPLSDAELAPIRRKIVKHMTQKHNINLIGVLD